MFAISGHELHPFDVSREIVAQRSRTFPAITEPVLLLIREATTTPDNYPTGSVGGRGWR
jgi:hypothetical protein